MPLIHGKSKKAFKHNVEAEMHADKPQKQALAIAYSLKRRAAEHKAEGGEAGEPTESQPTPVLGSGECESCGSDLAGRAMHTRHMSEGGEVANGPGHKAAESEDDFDDLSLDDGLEFHDTEANSGDDDDDAQEDHDRRDIVAKVMKSRAKKAGHNPKPA